MKHHRNIIAALDSAMQQIDGAEADLYAAAGSLIRGGRRDLANELAKLTPQILSFLRSIHVVYDAVLKDGEQET